MKPQTSLMKPPFNCDNTGCSYPNCVCGKNLSNTVILSGEPQTTPIKSAESEAKELLIELDQIAVNYDNYEYGLPTHTEPQYSEMIAQVMLFASLQTTAKEKEFCERLEKEIAKIELTISGYKNSAHDLFAAGYCTALEAQKVLLNKLIQNYKK